MEGVSEGSKVITGAGAEECRRGLNMRTRMRPKMISRRRNMHFRRPVFFWYLTEREEVSRWSSDKEG